MKVALTMATLNIFLNVDCVSKENLSEYVQSADLMDIKIGGDSDGFWIITNNFLMREVLHIPEIQIVMALFR